MTSLQESLIIMFAIYGIFMASFEVVKWSDKYLNYGYWFEMPEWLDRLLNGDTS